VIDTLKPFLAAILGHFMLKEPFNLSTAIGLIISSVGILIVALEKESINKEEEKEEEVDYSSSSSPGNSENGRAGGDCMTSKVSGSFSNEEQIELEIICSSYPNISAAAASNTASDTTSNTNTVSDEGNNIQTIGYIYAAINVILDAYGSVITKQYGYTMNTWEINLYRFGFAAICLGVIMSLCKFYYLHWNFFQKLLHSIGFHQDQSFMLLDDDSNHSSASNIRNNKNNIELSNSSKSPLFVIGDDGDEGENDDKIMLSDKKHCIYSQYSEVLGESRHNKSAVDDFHYSNSNIDDESDYNAHNEQNLFSENVDENEDDASSDNHSRWFELPFKAMQRYDWLKVSVGVLFVTFLCPAMSNYALFRLNLGLCLTLNSLGPVYSLPLLNLMKREPITMRAVLGVLFVMLGIVVLTSR
jgi:drug/metabolite transporter (DMT)-like permease